MISSPAFFKQSNAPSISSVTGNGFLAVLGYINAVVRQNSVKVQNKKIDIDLRHKRLGLGGQSNGRETPGTQTRIVAKLGKSCNSW